MNKYEAHKALCKIYSDYLQEPVYRSLDSYYVGRFTHMLGHKYYYLIGKQPNPRIAEELLLEKMKAECFNPDDIRIKYTIFEMDAKTYVRWLIRAHLEKLIFRRGIIKDYNLAWFRYTLLSNDIPCDGIILRGGKTNGVQRRI